MKERISRDMIGFLKYIQEHNKANIPEYLRYGIKVAKIKQYGSTLILEIPSSKLRSMQKTVKTLKDRGYIKQYMFRRYHVYYDDIILHSGIYYEITDKGRELIAKHTPNKTNNKKCE